MIRHSQRNDYKWDKCISDLTSMPLDHERHVIHALPCSFFGGIGKMQGNDD